MTVGSFDVATHLVGRWDGLNDNCLLALVPFDFASVHIQNLVLNIQN